MLRQYLISNLLLQEANSIMKIACCEASEITNSNSSFVRFLGGDTEKTSLDFVENFLVGSFEGCLEASVEGLEAFGAHSLGGAASLGSLKLESGLLVSLSLEHSLDLSSGGSLEVGVELLHHGLVLKGVLLGLVVETHGSAHFAELGLNLVRVDDACEVSASHHVLLEVVATLLGAGLVESAEHVVKSGEGVLGEDAESAEVSAGGKLEEVQAVHAAGVNTDQVAGGTLEQGVLVSIDDEGALAHDEAGRSHLALSSTSALGQTSADDVVVSADLAEGDEESLGGLNVEGVHDERELGNGLDGVAASLDERSASSGGEGRGDGVTLLVEVDLAVPFAPDLQGGEHARFTAHVTEGSLARAGSTGARNSGNTSDGTTSAPRLGGVLLAGLVEDSVRLATVLSHVGVNELDGIISDGCAEHSGRRNLRHGGGASFVGVDRHDGTGGHL